MFGALATVLRAEPVTSINGDVDAASLLCGISSSLAELIVAYPQPVTTS